MQGDNEYEQSVNESEIESDMPPANMPETNMAAVNMPVSNTNLAD